VKIASRVCPPTVRAKALPGLEARRVDESGRVYLELADATPSEAARGMALLNKLVT